MKTPFCTNALASVSLFGCDRKGSQAWSALCRNLLLSEEKTSLEVHILGDKAHSWNSYHNPLLGCPSYGRIHPMTMGASPWQIVG